ncbi:hypothetical protein PM082_016930 [Marasmius tenuissimus]|nr:hypothetical protein PM082_016930 [Marasmius tenuissimus]
MDPLKYLRGHYKKINSFASGAAKLPRGFKIPPSFQTIGGPFSPNGKELPGSLVYTYLPAITSQQPPIIRMDGHNASFLQRQNARFSTPQGSLSKLNDPRGADIE